jgi:hypothetical protein
MMNHTDIAGEAAQSVGFLTRQASRARRQRRHLSHGEFGGLIHVIVETGESAASGRVESRGRGRQL